MAGELKPELEAVREAYCAAYERANGCRPSGIRYERGWWLVKFNQHARTKDIIEWTERLSERGDQLDAITGKKTS